MRLFNKNIDLYTFIQRARRAGLRAMGLVVALFASRHANAYSSEADFLITACPGCRVMPYSICDDNAGTDGVDDGVIIGTAYQMCIPLQNKGNGYPQIQDANCVQKLEKIGMCAGGTGVLSYSGLSCASGAVSQAWGMTPSNACGFYESNGRVFTGFVEFYLTEGFSPNMSDYACCYMGDATSNGDYMCYYSSTSCIDRMMGGDYSMECGMGYVYERDSEDISCTPEFQEYFSSMLFSGWCANGSIYVEGVGALLISHYCYGSDFITSNLTQYFCGLVVEGCNNFDGYYFSSGAEQDPYMYAMNGSSYYCKECPTDTNAPWQCGISGFSIYSTGTGITSCYASPYPNPVTNADNTGAYELSFPSDCQYTE